MASVSNNLVYIKSIIHTVLNYITTVSDATEICRVIALYILVKPILINMMFKSINSIRRHHIIRQTIPYRKYPVGKVKLV